jgi:tryptophanyl-tRNA synthetase
MSKSELSDLSRINLTDDKDQIINKIKKAKTDTLPLPSTSVDLDKRLEAKNLMGIYSSLTDVNLDDTINKFSGKNFSEFKENLSQVLVDKLIPISNEIKKLLKEKSFLDQILDSGCQKADKIASEKLKKIQEIIGF